MSFPRYPKYKASGVEWLGEVPEHWDLKRLKHIASHNDEVLDQSTDPDLEIQYVDISNVEGGRGVVGSEHFRFAAAPSRARRRVRDGDVIISTVRTYLRAVAAIRDPANNLIVSTGFAVVRPRAQLHQGYLGYLLNAGYFIDSVIARSTGVSYPAINASDLVAITTPLPPLPEQRAIAAFLDRETAKIDGLVAEQQRLIELLKEKRQAVISHAVTKGLDPKAPMKPSGVEWLGDVPAHWKVRRLKTLIRSIEQGWSPQCEGDPAIDGGWGVLKVGCVNGDHFDPQENKAVPEDLMVPSNLEVHAGEVLMSRGNTAELVGMAGLVIPSAARLLLSDLLYRIEFLAHAAHAPYVVHLLRSGAARFQIRRDATGTSASMKKIAQSDIRELLLAFPPLPEQRAIAAFLNRETAKFDGLIAQAESAITLLQERRSALISAAVTGQIDVRNAATTEAA